jgi:probable selenium-dependent hydroxylase accessory protein YqeC
VNTLLEYSDVWIIGGGGKTTLMYRLAAAWKKRGASVICATTTKIWPPMGEQCADLRVSELSGLLADFRERPAVMVTVARRIEGGKCHGYSADETFSLKSQANHLVVEADGSAGRPVKAHTSQEPVIAAGAACVVAVVGGWCVGAPLDAEHVHRPEIFSRLSGRTLGDAVSADDVGRVILHEEGWLRAVPHGAAFYLVVTGADGGIPEAIDRQPNASRLAGVLKL